MNSARLQFRVQTWPRSAHAVAWLGGFVVLALLSGLARAAGNVDIEAERQALRDQRQQVDEAHQQALRACADRFEVTDCELARKAERQRALQPLLQRQHALDALEREQRAQAQQARVKAKRELKAQQVQAAQEAARAREEAVRQANVAAEAAAVASAAASAAAEVAPTQAQLKSQARSEQARQQHEAQAAREAASNRAATQRRINAAQARAKEVTEREAALVAKGKRAAPLSTPAAPASKPAVASSAVKN